MKPIIVLALTLLCSTPALAIEHPYTWMLTFADARPVGIGEGIRTYEARARRLDPNPNTADHVGYFAIEDVANPGWLYQRYIHWNPDTLEGLGVWKTCTFVKPNAIGRHITCAVNGVYGPWEFIPY